MTKIPIIFSILLLCGSIHNVSGQTQPVVNTIVTDQTTVQTVQTAQNIVPTGQPTTTSQQTITYVVVPNQPTDQTGQYITTTAQPITTTAQPVTVTAQPVTTTGQPTTYVIVPDQSANQNAQTITTTAQPTTYQPIANSTDQSMNQTNQTNTTTFQSTTTSSMGIEKSTFDNYYRPEDPNKINIGDKGSIDTKMSFIDAPIIDIIWCGEKRNTIFFLTEKSTLYRSVDDGFTGHILSNHLKKLGRNELGSEPGEVGEVSRIIQSPVDKSLLVIMGTHGINWVTEDCGANFRAMNQGRRVDEFLLHPTERNWVLASAWTICDDFAGEPCRNYKELFVSKDLGLNWSFAAHYVFQFAWAYLDGAFAQIPKDRVIISHDPKAKGNQTNLGWKIDHQVSFSDDFFNTTTVLLKGGNKFLLSPNFLFVVKVQDEREQEVTLYVGNPKDKKYFMRQIEIPNSRIIDHGYTILDASEHSVFLHIDHYGQSSSYGNVYISDSTGVRYSMALKNNVREFSGQCDFERIQALEGIYLANVYEGDAIKRFQNLEAERMSNFPVQQAGTKKTSDEAFKHPDHYVADLNTRATQGDYSKSLEDFKKTMISFDKGGIWQTLTPPEKDAKGKRILCTSEDECSLHLHSTSSGRFGSFYSTENSIGLILATGNIGAYLSYRPDEINTYLSRDGGLNWYEIAKGSHIYEVGDHGGLIVIAPDQVSTQKIYYSWNEGLTWQSLEVFDSPVQVTNILIEPTNTGEKFLVYGREQGGSRGVIAAVDFSSLHQKECVLSDRPDTPESDYETWTPNGRISPHCLLGRQITYVRRKRESECFNKEERESTWKTATPCVCTEEDWECDFGYVRQGRGVCQPMSEKIKNMTSSPPEVCEDYYYISQGYRKVAGNPCVVGVNHDPIQATCPGAGILNPRNLSVLALLGSIILVGIWMSRSENSERVKDCFGTFKTKIGAIFAKSPAKQGYTTRIPSSMKDEEDQFTNIVFEDNEETDEHKGEAIALMEDMPAKKTNERKALDAAKKEVPLIGKPGDKKMDVIRGNY